MRGLATLTLSILFFTSCQSIKSKEDIRNYINNTDNGLKKEIALQNNVSASLTFIPRKLIKRTLANDNRCYFSLKISRNHAPLLRQLDFNDYSDMVKTLSFRMPDFIHAYREGLSTESPLGCYFQQTYGMTPYDEIIMIFDAKILLRSEDIRITIDEFGLHLGSLDFEFNTGDILNLNHLFIDMT